MRMPERPSQSIPIIGRQQELDEIAKLLSTPECRLLTLVGSGGIGKTRLALEAVRLQDGNFANGTYFVPLQSLSSSEFIVPTIADVLEFTLYDNQSTDTQLIDFLRDKHVLLVLDNFEHLLPSADLLATMLQDAPDVKIVVTSRERLNLREEWVYDLAGLSIPEDEHIAEAESYAAIQLFMHCANRSAYTPVADDLPAIVRICQLVEGIPLAIELAATWVHVLSCQQIAAEIEHSLDILTTPIRNMPERHRSIRAVFDYTWHSLTTPQQRVFTNLFVFHGGWTRDAAQAIANTSLLDLQALVNKSLIRHSPTERYEIHELLRQYAAEQAQEAGIDHDIRDAHSQYYLDFLHRRAADINNRRQLEIADEIEPELENIFAAWRWAVECGDAEGISKATPTLFHFATIRTHEIEVEALFRQAQERFALHNDPRVWAKLTVRYARMVELGPFKHRPFRAEVEQCLDIAEEFADLAEIALCKLTLFMFIPYDDDTQLPTQQAANLLHGALALYEQLGDTFYVARTLSWLGFTATDAEMALDYQLKSREAAQAASGALLSGPIGISYFRLARYADSAYTLREGLDRAVDMGDKKWWAWAMPLLTRTEFFLGHFDTAQALYLEGQRMADQINYPLAKVWSPALLGLRYSIDPTISVDVETLTNAEASINDIHWYVKLSVLVSQMLVAYMQGDGQTARAELPLTLKFSIQKSSLPDTLVCLTIMTLLLADDDEHERAAEVLGLILNHPACPHGWFDHWPLLVEKRQHIEAQLGSEAYHIAWEHGRQQHLDAVINTLLDLPPTALSPVQQQTNQQLIEPLTDRELDIIRRLAQGLNSREIAEQLVLSVGTIRWYRKRIYDKLNVHSRSEALARAKQLNLLA